MTFSAESLQAEMPQLLTLLLSWKSKKILSQEAAIIFGHANTDRPGKSGMTELQTCSLAHLLRDIPCTLHTLAPGEIT